MQSQPRSTRRAGEGRPRSESRGIPGEGSFDEREEWEVTRPAPSTHSPGISSLTFPLPYDILLRVNSFIYSNDPAPHPPAPEITANPFKFTLLRQGAI